MRKRWRLLVFIMLPVILVLGGIAYCITGGNKFLTHHFHGKRNNTQTAPIVHLSVEPTVMRAGIVIKGNRGKQLIYSTPQWSPNGRTIAYVRSSSDSTVVKNGDLFLAEYTDGAWEYRLLAHSADWPRWSPDGSQIAFNQGALAVMDLHSGKTRKLIVDNLSDGEEFALYLPDSWSPNGRFLYFQAMCWEWGGCGCYDLQEGKVITFDTSEGVWMPDNRLLLAVDPDAYEEGDEYLGIFDPSTQKMRTLLRNNLGKPVFVSSDGHWAYLKNERGIDHLELSSAKVEQVLHTKVDNLEWNPDGVRYAFLTEQANGEDGKESVSLRVGSIEERSQRIIASTVLPYVDGIRDSRYAFSWSVDGKWMAYATEDGGLAILKP